MSEAQLLSAIMRAAEWLPDVLLLRNNSGARGRVRFGLQNRQLRTGSPDLIACVRGRFVALEVKLPGQSPRPDQKAFLEAIRASGGEAYVVTSVDEALEALREASK